MSQSVLVVDDDPFTRRLITTTLEDVGQFELYEAADGVEAVEMAQSTQPRLVFLDFDMPGLDGITACQRLRSASDGDDATIVLLADRCDGFERRAQEAGADIILTKPFSPLQLLRILAGLNAGAERRAHARSG
ncbi:MAG TPA: response regulator [Solirubrobacteraceae bacterium]|jgi:two-component system chemotaxis response regulator CheY|nr:response regulator [Solirubrobacteraceae bacterium]